MNRLRSHFAGQQELKTQRRLQSDIVREYRDDIVELIANDGARLAEVAAAVRAEGEPVLEPGFKAEILKQIGKVKDIRGGGGKAAAANKTPYAATTAQPPTPAPAPASQAVAGGAAVFLDEDDDDFAARRPRR